MYLTGLDVVQVSPPSYERECRVRVRWSYGDQDVDVVEFWWKADTDDRWTWIPPHVRVERDDPVTEALVMVPAGAPGLIHACPRVLDDRGTMQYRQPDEDGEGQIWNGFCLFTRFVGQRLAGRPPDRCRLAPEITAMEVGYGSVTVRWTDPEGYDRFRVDFAGPGSGGNPSTFVVEGREHRFDRLRSGGCWALVAGIHDAHGWTGHRECRSPASAARETSVPPELGYVEARFSPGAPVAALKQTPDHTEVFACLPDGKPVGIWSTDGTVPRRWNPWYGHDDGPGFAGGTPLAALSRDAGHMDVFGVASDGRLHLAWWQGNPWREWFVLSDNEFPPAGRVAALSRNTDQMDLFAVGLDGLLRSTWWNGDPWRDWFALPGAAFPPGAAVAAVSRNPDQMDVFAVGSDGVVRSNWWNGDPWRGWFALPGAAFPPGAPIAAVSRNPDQMDVFAVGSDGVVRSNWWNGNPWRGWFALPGAAFPPGAPIVAVSRNPDEMVVAAVATDGQARRCSWNGTWSGWEVLAGVAFPPGASLCVVAPGPLFGVANDGYLRANTLTPLRPTWYRVS